MKRNIVVAAVTAAALIGGGTATALAVTGDDDRDEPRIAAADATASDALAAALRHTPGTAVSAGLEDADDDEGGKAAWEVDVLVGDGTWHSVRVDPATGEVLGSRADTEDDDDTAEVRAALKGTSVTAAEAVRAASAKGTVTSVDLDDDGRSATWEAETRSGGGAERDWRVDPDTGKVTADRADDDSDDD
ncbi:PepSY domain-containing protein [Streptomyces sp. NPDC000134]|uniref:PepSY domain-containing protein n=1 Tax=Streptomyces sp. NPDC000134 TaxID=3364536 RepID=UPI003674A5B5